MGLLIPIRSLSPDSSNYPAGIHKGHPAGLPAIDPDLLPDNIKWNTTIFGVLGSMVIWQAQAKPLLSIPIPIIQSSIIVTASEAKTASPGLVCPVPVIVPATALATVSDPERTVLHDDAPPTDTEVTTEANSDPVIDQSWLQNDDNQEAVTTTTWKAMTFTPATNHTIRGVRLALYGSSVGSITVSIRATSGGLPTGGDLCSGPLDGSQLNGTFDGKVYDISLGVGTALTAGTVYAIVVRTGSGTLNWRSSAAGYDRGNKCSSTNSGGSWTTDATRELLFQEFGDNSLDVPATPSPTAVGDGLYIGNSTPFDYVDVWVNQAGVGTYTITWKYYNGVSWLPLTLSSDGDRSNSWKRPGRHTVFFNRPVDWAITSILTYALYWVKAEVTAYTSQATQPILGRVWIGAY
ncbi:hypothetical protein [Dehalococcoides mccartyi]|uniref:Uncharacterized protein n=1 Tax=Dehalococcoides mccartyi (strain VS) TaxID=311424 RepID=D2BGE4_DEHMV|nr:hypothetical protein [Dehalococcoides mccartyi]ACZ61394.1 hypothetical protein DhcVS_232 [Dehalococcoides mccartyi VS]